MDSAATLESLAIPTTLKAVLDPAWLTQALASVSAGRQVTAVETVEVLRTVATKVRFTVTFAGAAEPEAFCIKGLLDVDEMTARGGPTMVREADFYTNVGPGVAVLTPICVATITDRTAMQGIVVMRDLIAAGARFCSALEPFTADEAASSLDQLAALHAGRGMLDEMEWISPRVGELAKMQYISAETLQGMLDGPRGEGLSPAVRDAARLGAAMRSLAERDAAHPQFLVHGDAHAGNIFRDAQGRTGLIDWQLLQRGGWALDLAYHICAVLPVEVAEREERALLDHYLGTMRALGCDLPEREEAWRQYREAAIYGFYLWSITRRVDPPIIELFVNRLGMAVTRHDSHALLGVT
ncbi:MAG: phosphotransferase [Novosphingobium sp.]